MFRQSGVPGTILTKMNKLRNFFSLNFYIFFYIGVIGVVGCFFITGRLASSFRDTLIEKLQSQFREYCSGIANQMEITGYLSSPNSNIDTRLDTISELYGGRVLVTNAYHVIVYDSYETVNGKTLVSKNIANCLRGSEICEIDQEKKLAKLLFPLSPKESNRIVGAFIVQINIEKDLEEYQVAQRQMFAFNISVLVLFLTLLAFISWWQVHPVRKIERCMQHIALGYLNDTVSVNGNKEVASISRSTNEMLAKINQLEASRQEFVSNVSHELKTPMTSMKVLSESLLMQPDAPVEMYREFMCDINDQIDRENKIISDLLTLISLDKSSNELTYERTSINALVESVLKRVKPLAEQKGIEIVMESFREIYARVDEVKLMMAITNIVENAIKYNRECGYIHVTLNADLRYTYLVVEDSGIGMSETEIPHIFERFYRVDKARSRETGGTGLGLSIAKEIISQHKGTIKVSSKEREGTTFVIRLPLNL